MKKLLWLFCISAILTASPAKSEDDLNSIDEWRDISNIQDAWNG